MEMTYDRHTPKSGPQEDDELAVKTHAARHMNVHDIGISTGNRQTANVRPDGVVNLSYVMSWHIRVQCRNIIQTYFFVETYTLPIANNRGNSAGRIQIGTEDTNPNPVILSVNFHSNWRTHRQ